MSDWAVCAECNTRYDASGLAFCPRCGSNLRAGKPAGPGSGPVVPSRRDPARMRVQLGGILLLLVGGLYLAGSVTLAATLVLDPAALEAPLYELYSQLAPEATGGDLVVHVLAAGDPAQANVTLSANGTQLASGPTVDGRFNASTQGYRAIQVDVRHGDGTWVRKVIATSLATTEVTIDVASDPQETGRIEGSASLLAPTTWAFLGLSLFLVLGGLAAVLARWRGVALAGPLPILAFSAVLVAVYTSLGTLVLLAVVAVPYALVLSGRSAFIRR